MKKEKIKSEKNEKKSEFKDVYFTRQMSVKMSISPLNGLSFEYIIDGLNDEKFEIIDNEFVVVSDTLESTSPKIVALINKLDCYFGDVKDKGFKFTE